MRILGIDPGSRITGYGVISLERGQARHIANGCIRTPEGEMAERLRAIFEGVCAVISAYEPGEMAIEKVFVNRNVDSALKLGQARGAAIVAGASHGLRVFEFSPAEVKQAIVGQGRAEKAQVQHMIKVLLKLAESAESDAADALAVAICHGHTREALQRMAAPAELLRGMRTSRRRAAGLRR
jgi:crossover junction endodeoxyribonuclease RuvC